VSRLAEPQVRQKLENGNFVFLEVKHKNIRTLIDNGAHFSCISLSLLKALRLEKDVVPALRHEKLFT